MERLFHSARFRLGRQPRRRPMASGKAPRGQHAHGNKSLPGLGANRCSRLRHGRRFGMFGPAPVLRRQPTHSPTRAPRDGNLSS